MAKRKIPDTSRAAYDSVKGDAIREHYSKIIKALSKLDEATYEEIYLHGKFSDKNQVSRRLLEMVNLNLIVKTENKKELSTGRKGYTYKVAAEAQEWLKNKNTDTPKPSSVKVQASIYKPPKNNTKQVAVDFGD